MTDTTSPPRVLVMVDHRGQTLARKLDDWDDRPALAWADITGIGMGDTPAPFADGEPAPKMPPVEYVPAARVAELEQQVGHWRAIAEQLIREGSTFAGHLVDVSDWDSPEDSVYDDPRPDAQAPSGCPTCTGPLRQTAGMVCQTCGTDYAPAATATTSADEPRCSECDQPARLALRWAGKHWCSVHAKFPALPPAAAATTGGGWDDPIHQAGVVQGITVRIVDVAEAARLLCGDKAQHIAGRPIPDHDYRIEVIDHGGGRWTYGDHPVTAAQIVADSFTASAPAATTGGEA